MAGIRPLPGLDVPVVNESGFMNQAWYEFFQSIAALNLPAFSKTAPTNGQVPIYSSTTGLYTPGAN
jgi:hypothetical protein